MRTSFGSLAWRCFAAAVLLTCLAGFTGCVSMDDYKRLDNALHEARSQLAAADAELATLHRQIDELRAQLAQYQAAGSGTDALRADNALLKRKLDELLAKYNELVNTSGKISLPAPVNQALMDLAAQYPDLLEYDPELGRLRFKSDLTFELGSTEVRAQARAALQTLAGILNAKEIANNQIRIVGHTDDVPIRTTATNVLNPNNWFLSTNRAHAVREVLEGDGVADTRIQPAGEGPTQPIAPNAAGHKGNEKNRRVEIYILPSMVPANAVPAPESDSRPVASGARPAAAAPVRRPTAAGRAPAATAPAIPEPTRPLPAPLPGGAG
jgi:flagellar motor protein MotB